MLLVHLTSIKNIILLLFYYSGSLPNVFEPYYFDNLKSSRPLHKDIYHH